MTSHQTRRPKGRTGKVSTNYLVPLGTVLRSQCLSTPVPRPSHTYAVTATFRTTWGFAAGSYAIMSSDAISIKNASSAPIFAIA
jgi:hypothetical protein